MKEKTKIYFRADGHAKMGLGHIIRSLALADMLRDEFDCHFIIRAPLPTIREQILNVCNSIIELYQTENNDIEAHDISEKYLTGNEIVVLDGYHFRTSYQQIIKNKGCKLVCIDDIHAYHFVADIVINHAGGISKEDYSAESYTEFYLGLKYALLRKPFREAAQNKLSLNKRENTIFVCLGGADPNNDTMEILKKCEQLKDIESCYVVLGGAYSHREKLDSFLEKTTLNITLLSNLDATEMVTYMKRCKKAITPPSSISYEYLCVGGELYLKVIADNQLNINKYFLDAGLAFSYNDYPLFEKEDKVKEAIKIQNLLLDGQSNKRFLKIFST